MSDCLKCGEFTCKHGKCECDGQCNDCAERQEQEQIQDYYGGSGPMSDRERLEIAAAERWSQR